jgi:hypothetical protein
LKYAQEIINGVLFVLYSVLGFFGTTPVEVRVLCGVMAGYQLSSLVNSIKIRRIHKSYENLMSLRELEEEFMKKVFEPEGDVDEFSAEQEQPGPVFEKDRKKRN